MDLIGARSSEGPWPFGYRRGADRRCRMARNSLNRWCAEAESRCAGAGRSRGPGGSRRAGRPPAQGKPRRCSAGARGRCRDGRWRDGRRCSCRTAAEGQSCRSGAGGSLRGGHRGGDGWHRGSYGCRTTEVQAKGPRGRGSAGQGRNTGRCRGADRCGGRGAGAVRHRARRRRLVLWPDPSGEEGKVRPLALLVRHHGQIESRKSEAMPLRPSV